MSKKITIEDLVEQTAQLYEHPSIDSQYVTQLKKLLDAAHATKEQAPEINASRVLLKARSRHIAHAYATLTNNIIQKVHHFEEFLRASSQYQSLTQSLGLSDWLLDSHQYQQATDSVNEIRYLAKKLTPKTSLEFPEISFYACLSRTFTQRPT